MRYNGIYYNEMNFVSNKDKKRFYKWIKTIYREWYSEWAFEAFNCISSNNRWGKLVLLYDCAGLSHSRDFVLLTCNCIFSVTGELHNERRDWYRARKRRLTCKTAVMYISTFPPEGVAGIPWGLDSQNSHYPQEFDRRPGTGARL